MASLVVWDAAGKGREETFCYDLVGGPFMMFGLQKQISSKPCKVKISLCSINLMSIGHHPLHKRVYHRL